MLNYIYGSELNHFPKLRETMFTDRARQFSDRLGWSAITVNEEGFETDDYDSLNPLYVIWETKDGTHGGSMRLLPTVGRTMVNDHFLHLTDGVKIESPLIWECTRLCISPTSDSRVTAALVVAAGEIMSEFSIEHLVGVFYSQTGRVFGLNGIIPDILGSNGTGKDRIDVGVWEVTPIALQRALKRLRISRATSKAWFKSAFDRSLKSSELTSLTKRSA